MNKSSHLRMSEVKDELEPEARVGKVRSKRATTGTGITDKKRVESDPQEEEEEEEEEEASDEYDVERIVRRRGAEGSRRYLIKWVGYERQTWISRADFVTTEIVDKYDKQMAKKAAKRGRTRKRGKSGKKVEDSGILERSGFDLGLKVERVVGAAKAKAPDAMVYVVLYDNGKEGLVGDIELYAKAPEQVIQFLEKNMRLVGGRDILKNTKVDDEDEDSDSDEGTDDLQEVHVETVFPRDGKHVGEIDGFLTVGGSLIALISTLKRNTYIVPFRLVLAHAPEMAAKYISSVIRWVP